MLAGTGAAIVLLGSLLASIVEAQTPEPMTSGGDPWSRPRLTGSWGGLRDDLGKRGVTLDVDLSQFGQGVASGGRETGFEYSGVGDYTLNVDTGKLGLWPGGFLNVHAQNRFGRTVNKKAGALEAVNGYALFPKADGSVVALPNLTFAQFLARWFGLYLGKIDTLGGDENEFAHYDPNKFMNVGFDFNLTLGLVPISTLGGGIILLPTQDPAEAIVSLSVFDSDGKTTTTGFDNFFTNGVMLAGEARVRIKPFGLTGHQLLGGTWSNKDRVSLDQDPSNIARMLLFSRFPRLEDPGPLLRDLLSRFFPSLLVPVQPLKMTTNAWSVYYNFDQFLWSPEGHPDRGVGVFFRFGVSDGIANPIKYHYNAGVGGKGVVPGRPQDSFGIGWSNVQFSNNLVPFLRQRLGLGLEHENAVEMYYNAALTGWLNLTADLQIVNPGLKKTLDPSAPGVVILGTPVGPGLKDVNTAVVAGVRLYTRF
jgi:porin